MCFSGKFTPDKMTMIKKSYLLFVYLSSTLKECSGYRHNEDRSLINDYSIGDTTVDMNMTEIILSNRIQDVSNNIGSSVVAGDITVQLFSEECHDVKDNAGLEVEVNNTSYDPSLFTYDIIINPDLIATSPGGFVHFEDQVNFSNGIIRFCTRVTTFVGSTEMIFKETNFQLDFDWSGTFMPTNLTFTDNPVDLFVTEMDTSYFVQACQCNGKFECYSPPPVGQNQNLNLCIEPTGGINVHEVYISNFNIQLSAGIEEYTPVSFGSSSWSNDGLTIVTRKGDTMRVSAPVPAWSFRQNEALINVTGSAFLEYKRDTNEKMKMPLYRNFHLQVEIATISDTSCIDLLLNNFFFTFSRFL